MPHPKKWYILVEKILLSLFREIIFAFKGKYFIKNWFKVNFYYAILSSQTDRISFYKKLLA